MKLPLLLILFILLVGCQKVDPSINQPVESSTESLDLECSVNDDCNQNEECIDNNCQVPVCGENEQVIGHNCVKSGVECTVNKDCIGSEKCVNNECVPRVTDLPPEETISIEEPISFESCGTIKHGQCSGLQVCDNGKLKESVLNCGCPIDKVIIDGQCQSLSFTNPVKVAIIEIISEDLEIPVTTYHCNTKTCRTGIQLCDPDESGCERFDINFVETINNPLKVASIHLADEPMSAGTGIMDLPFGPWYSFYYIDDWYAQQAKEMTGSRKEKIEISIFGPYKVSDLPPVRGRTDPCYEILNPYFEKIAEQKDIDLDAFDVINYVNFDDISRGTGRFLSCATSDGITFNNIFMSVDNINVELQTVAHETAHILGAFDLYNGYLCDVPEGIPEPNKSPLYPQTKACLMCGSIMLGESSSGGSSLIDNVICRQTAEEIGWI